MTFHSLQTRVEAISSRAGAYFPFADLHGQSSTVQLPIHYSTSHIIVLQAPRGASKNRVIGPLLNAAYYQNNAGVLRDGMAWLSDEPVYTPMLL